MYPDENATKPPTAELGIYPPARLPQAASVAPEVVSDPILDLIAAHDARQSAQVVPDSATTQGFVAYAQRMSAANIAEFGQRKRRIKKVRIGVAVTVAIVGLVLIVIGLSGGM